MLETDGVAQHSLDASDVWERISPSGDRVSVSVYTNRRATAKVPVAQHLIE